MCYRFGHCIIVLFLFSLLFVFFKLWTRNRGNHNAQKCIKYINKISSNLLWILNTYANKCALSFHLYILSILPKISWSVAILNILRFWMIITSTISYTIIPNIINLSFNQWKHKKISNYLAWIHPYKYIVKR